MTDRPGSDFDDELSAELVHVRNTVACELNAQLAMRHETIDLAAVCGVAYAVAVRLGREFRFERVAGQQEGLRDDDSLGLDGAAFYGSVLLSHQDPGPAEEHYPIFDYRWPSRS